MKKNKKAKLDPVPKQKYVDLAVAKLINALQALVDDTYCTWGDNEDDCLCPHCNGQHALRHYDVTEILNKL